MIFICCRIKQRRNVKLAHLLLYLENPEFISQKTDIFGEKIVRKDIEKFFLNLWERLYPEPTLDSSNSSRFV